ncbi:uncharacterized protein LOC125723837 isoform X1 [Brienomyrus brachyistius]|uniref:uncharacterized protein LOC125723837 isoform X1 n=2 Tax=Brienomyrus brachyistius TaxID=42636 RepID=UPI0020B45EE9|nr:uncharacterized protein LOC125723837 isoform X1 [Brienomyrus brachyistius]
MPPGDLFSSTDLVETANSNNLGARGRDRGRHSANTRRDLNGHGRLQAPLTKGLEVGVWKMGGGSSTELVVEQERRPELLKDPWRNVVWNPSTRKDLVKYIQDYKPLIDSVPQARILLIGQITAGKSSFFNSINSIFRGNITSQADVGFVGTSLTLKYRTYEVMAGRGGQPLGFLLCDTMGLEATANGGVKTDDIERILNGYIPDDYQFNPASPWQPGAGQTELQIKDRIHCVVYVIDSSTLGIMATEMKKKVDEIRKKTSFQDVPLLVLLTHVDRACPHVEKELKKVYHSCYIKDMIYRASGCLGIRPSNVIPVKNYHDESELNNTCDILLLKAMKQMLDFADNYFDNCQKAGVGKMGSGSSTPVTEENKPELLGKAWRDVVWDHSTRTDLKQYLQDYKPTIDSVPQARILLIGQITAGKSSFFNSINSIFRGNITSQAAVGEMKTSLTLKYHTYQVKAGRGGQPLGFLLCDTMGLEAREDGGVRTEDIESILKGYVPDKYQFNPAQPMKADNSQAWSTLALKDRIHCVVYVIDASTTGIVDQGMKNKIDEIRKRTNSAEVPLLVLLTHVDKACSHVEEDLKKVYHSCYIKDLIYRASECLGILPSNVIPVKNYFDESELSDTCDILLLKAMKQMLDFADNYFDSWEDDTE